MVERVLAVREVRGSIPGLGRFRVYHFRNVQHNTKVPISYMVAQVGFVLLPYGPGFVSWLDLRASSPICLGACTKYDLYNFWYDRRRCGPLWRIDRDEYRNEVYY